MTKIAVSRQYSSIIGKPLPASIIGNSSDNSELLPSLIRSNKIIDLCISHTKGIGYNQGNRLERRHEMTYQFKKAVPVWGKNLRNEYNQFLGFYTGLTLKKDTKVKIAAAARSYYRMYVNGEVFASGPARTAKGYLRVDERELTLSGEVWIAVEVLALDKPEKYSNDCTLEPGLFICEITAGEEVLSATGDGTWQYKELLYRRSLVETMSHSRGIVEVYDLDEHSMDWISGRDGIHGEDYIQEGNEPGKTPAPVTDPVKWLERRAPYPSCRKIGIDTLLRLSDVEQGTEGMGSVTAVAAMFNQKWYSLIPEENKFIEKLAAENEAPFTGTYEEGIRYDAENRTAKYRITPGNAPAAAIFRIPGSELGFLQLHVEVQEDSVVDLINSDHLDKGGELRADSYSTRYYLKKGSYCLTTFEPKLTRFVKIVLRTKKEAVISSPVLLDYSYPDHSQNWFECSDGELNLIYEAARRTLRLNTLDIFMDCPQRERGGWLCDSHFTAAAAWQIFGDLSVEKDFIENFMLTDPDVLWNSFFPEVYPGSHRGEEEIGISSWSFWLMTELYDFAGRSGDRGFIERCRPRVERFINGVLSLRGESGLLENLPNLFVDWSISNKPFNLYPISLPNNCLAVYMLEEMAELYGVAEWSEAAVGMRKKITDAGCGFDLFAPCGDAARYENGRLIQEGCMTESGCALELFSNFWTDHKEYVHDFVKTMGTCPEERANPNIGKSNLFIGLMIRFAVLSRLGKTDVLVRELKDVYMPQILLGSGTLFENISETSGCHGFNAYAGALIVNDVLGLGQPMKESKTVRICPHPGTLDWACGTADTGDGKIQFSWSADRDGHVLNMKLNMPEGWKPLFEIPFELYGWTLRLNGNAYEA